MREQKRKKLAALMLAASLLCGCGAAGQQSGNIESESTAEAVQDTEVSSEETASAEDASVKTETVSTEYAGSRPMLIKDGIAARGEDSVAANAEPYVLESDLSNVENLWQFYLDDGMTEKLVMNGFVVCGEAGSEFFNIYEDNRYNQIPNFVTVDSLMHTYHLYFSYLLKNIERDTLADSVAELSNRMLADSVSQYEELAGSEWETAAARNVAFFAVGAKLFDDQTEVPDYVLDVVQKELDRIYSAAGIEISGITGDEEDYTQYVPRGYYEGDEQLERYFRAMMWYGRMHFSQEETDLDRSALLMTMALESDSRAYGLWEAVYAVTSFFAGASDDLGVCEYAPVLHEAYGAKVAASDLAGNEEAFDQFHALTGKLDAPQINSIPIMDGESNIIPGFRFMGQRFTIDASIMQKLIYSNVEENSAGESRMLPDVLDVPAALGSDVALGILEEEGATGYAGYSENMAQLRTNLSADNGTLWSASLYASWLNTLRPLLTVKGEGWPTFMQGEEWAKKDLECFAGSFTELKHDTILYSKQVMAEMGGGWDEEPDDRGYVEPEPLVYERFGTLADATAQGLKEYGMLSAADEENLTRLSQIAEKLLTISEKELRDETLSEEEYDFIKDYGGNLEHFWYEAVGEENGTYYSQECPAALVVDIATDPNGQVLEAATGNPSRIYVVVKVDGKLKLATGSVYSFYQFAWPMDNRLTDREWQVMTGLLPDENGEYHYKMEIDQPEWTASYRYEW